RLRGARCQGRLARLRAHPKPLRACLPKESAPEQAWPRSVRDQKSLEYPNNLRPARLSRRPIALSHRVQPHEVRGTRSELRSRHQAEHVPGAEKTFRQQFFFGGPEHRLRRLPLFFVNRMHAPKRIHAIADFRLTTE